VGVVVSGEPPTWNFMTVGFAEGVKATNGSARLLYSVIGEGAYDDSAGAKRVTEQQLAAGADVIFGMGDGASFGMIEAVREHNEANPDSEARFIDVIGDKREEYADVLLTSVVFDFKSTYVQMVKDLEAGTFGKVYTLDVQNKGVRLLELPEDVPQEIKDKLAAVEADIVAGKITVSAIGDAEGCGTSSRSWGTSDEGAGSKERGAGMKDQTVAWPRINAAAGPVEVSPRTLRAMSRRSSTLRSGLPGADRPDRGLLKRVFRTDYDVSSCRARRCSGSRRRRPA
jgi:hypothetical protein